MTSHESNFTWFSGSLYSIVLTLLCLGCLHWSYTGSPSMCRPADWSRGVTWPEACLLIGREGSDAGKWLRASWLVFRSVFVMLLPWDEIPGLIIDSNFIIRVLNELSELSVTLLTLQFKSWLASLLVNEAVRVDSSVWGILHSSSWRWPILSFLNVK